MSYIGRSSERSSSGAFKFDVRCDICQTKFSVRKRALKHDKHFCKNCGIPPHNKKYDHPFTDIPCAICLKKFPIETDQYYRRIAKGKIRFACSAECKRKLQSITIKEIRSTDVSRAKTSEQMSDRWQDPKWSKHFGALMHAKPPEWHQARLAKALATCRAQPTKPERWLIDFFARHKLPFEYVGDGQLWIGQLNPDFASTDTTKRLVEMFGCYWHGCAKCFPGSNSHGIPLNQRLSTFKKYGYDTLVIWQHEMADPGFESRLLGILTPCPLSILVP